MTSTVNEKTNSSKSSSPSEKKEAHKGADAAAKKAEAAKKAAIARKEAAAKKAADAKAKKEAAAEKKAADAKAKKEAAAEKKAADVKAKKEAAAEKKAADVKAKKEAAAEKKAADVKAKKAAAAEKKAAKLAERKAAAAEKKAARAAKKTSAASEDKKAAKADKKAAKSAEKREKKERKGRKGLAKPPFELSLSINLSRDFDRVMRNAFSEAGKAVVESIHGQLTIPADTKPKAVRELEKLRKSIGKSLEKALIAFGTRTLDSGKIHIKELQAGTDGGNLTTAPMQQVLAPGFAKRHLGLFRNILSGLQGDAPDLKRFADLPAKIDCPFGTSLENDYFLMGNLSFIPDFDKPSASEVSYAFDLFAKNGKKMGMRLQFSMSHDLSPDNFKNELRVEVPETGK